MHKNKQHKQPQSDRRRVLKSTLLVGGVASTLPTQWKRPVIDSILLPSHASTTTPEATNLGTEEQPAPPPPVQTVNYYTDQMQQYDANASPAQQQNIAERILETIIPSASAVRISNLYYACIAITGNTYTAKIIIFRNGFYFDEYDGITGTVGSAGTHSLTNQYCGGGTGMPDIGLLVSNVTDNNCLCTITESFQSDANITVPKSACNSPDLRCLKK